MTMKYTLEQIAEFTNISYSQTQLIHVINTTFKNLKDIRKKPQLQYSLREVLMAAFGTFHSQHPTLAEGIRSYEGKENNYRNLYNVNNIPTDDTVRDILDDIDPDDLFRPCYKQILGIFQRSNHLKKFKFLDDKYLVIMDGTQYFASKKLNCERCNKKRYKNGVTYSHSALQYGIVNPYISSTVLPLYAQEIAGEGEHNKQDCEYNAAIRSLPKIKQDHPKLPVIIVGDALFGTEKLLNNILSQGWDFIVNVKCKSHSTVNDNFDDKSCNKLTYINHKGAQITCYWQNDLDFTNSGDMQVNFIKAVEHQSNGETKYLGSWVTNITITTNNASEIVAGGRARWMIENEFFNTLKNAGYHLEHNYGHGAKHLSFNFYGLTLLSFLCHNIANFTDPLTQAARKECVTRDKFWQTIRVMIERFVVNTWEQLMAIIGCNKKLGSFEQLARGSP